MKRKSAGYSKIMGVILYAAEKAIMTFGRAPFSGKNFPVDGEIRIRHVANGIMKQAGIDYHF
jgi:hypothetical protein